MKQNYFKRYCIFFLGLIFNSFGVALVTKAALGTSPIAAIPYTLSLIIPRLTLGNWTIVFSILLVLAQLALLRKSASKLDLILQAVISFFFGYFIDFSMKILSAFYPEIYVIKIISLVAGCVIIAFGAYLEVIADVTMLPGDGFVRAVSKVSKKEYGSVRVISDVSMTVAAGILCLVFLRRLSGVREGTVIAALITGNIIKIFKKILNPLTVRK